MTTRSAAPSKAASARNTSSQADVAQECQTSIVHSPEAFCADLWGPVVGTLTVKLGDRGVAEELAQEALARAWERWPEVSQMEAPDRWVFRVALNLASSWIRRRAAERRAKQRLAASHATSAPSAGGEDDSIDLRRAIRTLPNREREVIILRYYGGLSVRDVASLLKISEGSVKSAAFDARSRLRITLELSEPEEER